MTSNTDTTAIATTTGAPAEMLPSTSVGVFGSMQAFENGQRVARALAASNLVPSAYQGNMANCLVALDMAMRANIPPMAVFQGLNVIHGRPSWSASYVAGAIAASGLFSPLRHEMRGTEGTDDWACRAYAKDLRTGEQVQGPWVTIKMAKAEGWYDRTGSKWKTMPEVMLRNRATTFFGRIYASHILNGMHTAEEIEDVIDITPAPAPAPRPMPAAADPEAITRQAQETARRQRRPRQADVEDVTPAQAPAQAPEAPTHAPAASEAPAGAEPQMPAPAADGEFF